MKKSRIITAFIAVVCALSLGCLVACGGGGSNAPKADDDVALITADIEQVIGTTVKAEDIVAGFKEDAEFMDLADLVGLDIDAYADALAQSMKCEVASVEVNGETAVATLEVSSPDYDAMYANLDVLLEDALANADTDNMTEDDLYKLVGQILMETATGESMPIKTKTVAVDYTKVDGTWTIDDINAVTTALENAVA